MKRKLLSLLLSLSMVMVIVSPSNTVIAQGDFAQTSLSTENENGLILNKTAKPDGKGGYKIRLEAYTTGDVTSSVSTKPIDIVLVLDQSGSMAYDFQGNATSDNLNRRQYATKQAINNFIDSVYQKYDNQKSDHRISVVTFASNASVLQGWTNVNEQGKIVLQDKINKLPDQPSGATNTAAGMEKTKSLLDEKNNDATSTTREKVVIMFTDGVPTANSNLDVNIANNAIDTAKKLKESGVSVYSVGIFSGANPEQLHGEKWDYEAIWNTDIPCSGQVNSYWGGSWFADIVNNNDFELIDIPAGNRFLNFLSSNFNDANKIGVEKGSYNPGDVFLGSGRGFKITKNFNRTNSKYYLTANNSESLKNIFQQISDQIETSHIDLDSATVVKDIVSPYFNAPTEVSKINLYTSSYDGSSKTFGNDNQISDGSIVATINDRSVAVTGFDFNKNFITEQTKEDGSYGKKLIIEFVITPKSGFLGGNSIPTNGSNSGVYTKEGNAVAMFVSPIVNIPINYDYTVNDQTIFLGELADLSNRIVHPDMDNGINNAFVNIEYAIVDNNNNNIGSYNINAGNPSGTWLWTNSENGNYMLKKTTEFRVLCNITPINPVSGEDASIQVQKKFSVIVESGVLTIKKEGGNTNESYVFNIKKDNVWYMTVTVAGNESVDITRLAKGEYTVEEETDWSWRFQNPVYDKGNTITINSNNKTGIVNCINQKTSSQWLNHYDRLINSYNGEGA